MRKVAGPTEVWQYQLFKCWVVWSYKIQASYLKTKNWEVPLLETSTRKSRPGVFDPAPNLCGDSDIEHAYCSPRGLFLSHPMYVCVCTLPGKKGQIINPFCKRLSIRGPCLVKSIIIFIFSILQRNSDNLRYYTSWHRRKRVHQNIRWQLCYKEKTTGWQTG